MPLPKCEPLKASTSSAVGYKYVYMTTCISSIDKKNGPLASVTIIYMQ